MVYDDGMATVEGTMTAPNYIQVQDAVKTASDGVPGTVRMKLFCLHRRKQHCPREEAPLARRAEFDMDPARGGREHGDHLERRDSVTDVKAGGASIGSGNYVKTEILSR